MNYIKCLFFFDFYFCKKINSFYNIEFPIFPLIVFGNGGDKNLNHERENYYKLVNLNKSHGIFQK